MPKLNSNDAEYLLVEWLVPDGTEVKADDVVVSVETSKAVEELTADADGPLHHIAAPGTWCKPNELIANIDPAPSLSPARPSEKASSSTGTSLITAPAQALMDELGISREQVETLGRKVIRRTDIEQLKPHGIKLSKVQQAVARAVELSHQAIPAAYTVVRMNLCPALERAAAATREIRRPVGVAELFVQAVTTMHADFPLFFSRIDGDQAIPATSPNVGITVDVGEGLYVPVLHDPGDLKEIATTLMKYRVAAASGSFKEADLSGANFVITLHTEGEVVLAIPFVFPGTTCALAVASPGESTYVGLAYDHRLINGREVALFLAELRRRMEAL
jgi:2-oxoglutarate dehydrogenase E2 component (dihydrolipoamide succinyltransferase)